MKRGELMEALRPFWSKRGGGRSDYENDLCAVGMRTHRLHFSKEGGKREGGETRPFKVNL